jgi:hypothetical protein
MQLDDPPFKGDGNCVGTACRLELMHDVLAMIVYGPFRDPQDPGYVPGALPSLIHRSTFLQESIAVGFDFLP